MHGKFAASLPLMMIVSIFILTGSGCPKPAPVGAVKVTLHPATAVELGVQWSVDDGGWQASETTVGKLTPGDHTISFSDLAGWREPEPETATVLADQTLELEALYQKEHTLTITSLGTGLVTPDLGIHVYLDGDEISLTATPGLGWMFDHWEGDLGGESASATVEMNADKTVTAVFIQVEYTLTVLMEGLGSVDPIPGIHTYAMGATASLLATAAEDWSFEQWSGDLTETSASAELFMDGDKEVTAHFAYDPPQYAIEVTVDPAGGGSVALLPAAGAYDKGTMVTLNAVPAADYRFTGWSGDVTGNANPTTVVMNSDKAVTATFVYDPAMYTLTAWANPAGGGTLELTPRDGSYASGTEVSILATPALHYRFTGWEGAISGETNPATVVMDGDLAVQARFEYDPALLTVTTTASPVEGGIVLLSPPGGSYVAGTELTVAALPADGYRFEGWQGGLAGMGNPATITVNEDVEIGAQFAEVIPNVVLGVSVDPPQGGYVNVDPSGGRYALNTQVRLMATAASLYTFLEWQGDVEGTDNPLDLIMDTDKQVTAVFDWEVKFPDDALDAVVRDMLGMKSTDVLLASDLSLLTELDASAMGIEIIEGLQHCPNLVHINLSGNQIENLWPLVNNPDLGKGVTIDVTDNSLNWLACDAIERLEARGITVISDDVCSGYEFVSLRDYWPMAEGNAWEQGIASCPENADGHTVIASHYQVQGFDVWESEPIPIATLGAGNYTYIIHFVYINGWLCDVPEDQMVYLPDMPPDATPLLPERIVIGQTVYSAGVFPVTFQRGSLSTLLPGIDLGSYDGTLDCIDAGIFFGVLGKCLGPLGGAYCEEIGEATIVGGCEGE